MKKKIYLALVLVFLIAGCTQMNGVSNNHVKVTPSTLFEGDVQKLGPHLDMITGCVRVKYKGNKESLNLKYEIWENGKLKESANITSTSISNNEFDGEVSISLKEIIGTDLEKSDFMIMKTIISEDNGYIGSTKHIERFDKAYGYGPTEIMGELNVTDVEEIAVWGLSAHQGVHSSGIDVEDIVKRADWGLILKIYFK